MITEEQQLRERLQAIATELKNSKGYTDQQLITIISDDTHIPATIFSGKQSPLRALVTYLHRNKKMELNKIAQHTQRSYRAVWGADMKERIEAPMTEHHIPLSCFNKKKSVLEAAVTHLRGKGMRFTDIARLLNKDPRTIWTAWNRAQKKR